MLVREESSESEDEVMAWEPVEAGVWGYAGEMWFSGDWTDDCGEREDCWFFMALVAQATPAFWHSSGTMPLRHWSDGKQSVGMPVDAVAIGVGRGSSKSSKSKYSVVAV